MSAIAISHPEDSNLQPLTFRFFLSPLSLCSPNLGKSIDKDDPFVLSSDSQLCPALLSARASVLTASHCKKETSVTKTLSTNMNIYKAISQRDHLIAGPTL